MLSTLSGVQGTICIIETKMLQRSETSTQKVLFKSVMVYGTGYSSGPIFGEFELYKFHV